MLIVSFNFDSTLMCLAKRLFDVNYCAFDHTSCANNDVKSKIYIKYNSLRWLVLYTFIVGSAITLPPPLP